MKIITIIGTNCIVEECVVSPSHRARKRNNTRLFSFWFLSLSKEKFSFFTTKEQPRQQQTTRCSNPLINMTATIKTKPNSTIANVRRVIILVTTLIILPFAAFYYLTYEQTPITTQFSEEPTDQQVHISIVSDSSKKIQFDIEGAFNDFVPRKYRNQYGITTSIKNNVELLKLNHSLIQSSEIPYLINLDEIYSTNDLNYIVFLPEHGISIENSTTNTFTIDGFGTIGILNKMDFEEKDLVPFINIFKANLLKALEDPQRGIKKVREIPSEITAFTPMDHKLAIFLPILGPVTITILSSILNFHK